MITKEMQNLVLSGRWVMTPQETAQRILDLRQSGYTWREIDQTMFPEVPDECIKQRGGSPAYNLAKKLNVEAAFTKSVAGCFTPTQVVTRIRSFKKSVSVAAPEHARITMADLGL